MKFQLNIVTPSGIYLNEQVDLLYIKTKVGYMTVLPKHAPMTAMLDIAPMYTKTEGKVIHYAISGGFINIRENAVYVVANTIESQEEIDLARAEAAKNRAQTRLENKKPDTDLKRAQSALMRAIVRINVKTQNKN